VNDLIEWLESGITGGHITAEEAFKWLAKKADSTAPSRLRPVAPVAEEGPMKVRLKKDGTPWAKRGSKMKQADLPTVGDNK
jgi:hypothetical protein